MDQRQKNDLDRHITGNWGEDSVPSDPVTELETKREKYLKELEDEGYIVKNCGGCRVYYDSIRATGIMPFAPRHKPSDSCESGKHPHCTCDTCF